MQVRPVAFVARLFLLRHNLCVIFLIKDSDEGILHGERNTTYNCISRPCIEINEGCPKRNHNHILIVTRRVPGKNQVGLSLGLAIDMLWPCHWMFVGNLQLVLGAIGGDLDPKTPFAACGRNIALSPLGDRMEVVGNTLKVFCGGPDADKEVDRRLLALLGEPTDVKRWLAASLDKTIRLQQSPPAELRAMSALAGPDWIAE